MLSLTVTGTRILVADGNKYDYLIPVSTHDDKIINRCAQSIKDTIQKQFTTQKTLLESFKMLCSVYQRYNSKAIHNIPYWCN